MDLMDRLERKFGKYIPENITMILLVGQVLSYLLVYTSPILGQLFLLHGESLMQGEVWRLVTFIFGPVSESLIFVIFAWYFFYLLGTSLENKWGSFRYLVFLLIAYIGNVIFIFIFPSYPIRNTYLFASLFLTFAHLYPQFQVLLFFIIPVKVKWLGYAAWIMLAFTFVFGGIEIKALILFSVANYFIFFYKDILYSLKIINKGLFTPAKSGLRKEAPRHICAVCAKNEIDNPDMEIRYCNTCFPETCYCGEHIRDHQHKKAVN